MSRMLEEIREQPEALARTLAAEMRRMTFKRRIEKQPPRLVVLAARGTSDNAALFGRYLLEITTGIPVSLAAPSIATLYQARVDYRDALVVAISQSGESTDTNLVLEQARKQGAVTIGITNEPPVRMARLAEHAFLVHARQGEQRGRHQDLHGPDADSLSAGARAGRRVRDRRPAAAAGAREVALGLEPEIAAVAERYRFMRQAVVVGRGLNYANAFEFSLKLMETCYVVAERFSSADFMHGPIAMVDPSLPVFAFAPAGVTWVRWAKCGSCTTRAEILAITDAGNTEVQARHARDPAAAEHSELFTPIPFMVPAQLFAACLAELKGSIPISRARYTR